MAGATSRERGIDRRSVNHVAPGAIQSKADEATHSGRRDLDPHECIPVPSDPLEVSEVDTVRSSNG